MLASSLVISPKLRPRAVTSGRFSEQKKIKAVRALLAGTSPLAEALATPPLIFVTPPLSLATDTWALLTAPFFVVLLASSAVLALGRPAAAARLPLGPQCQCPKGPDIRT